MSRVYVFRAKFNPPPWLPLSQQVEYCKRIVEKHRQEARVLRKDTAWAKLQQRRFKQESETWKEKYHISQEELKYAKLEIDRLRKEKEKLEKEIERLTKSNHRYQVSLFDHGNFKSPDSEDNEDNEKKTKGGQLNHADTNRESQVTFPGYGNFPKKRIYAKSCGRCGSSLNRVNATKEKVLLDIVLKPEIIQILIQSERQWCRSCKVEISAKSPQTLPFTEYGLNTFLMVMILRFKAHSSLSIISKVLQVGFGLAISKSDVSSILKQAARYLGKKYDLLKQAVRNGDVIYADETGWQVKGQKAWMWIMANEQTTVYVAAESRGKGIAQDMYGDSNSYTMTDGLSSYSNIPSNKHLFCWAHMLRFSFEETIKSKPTSNTVILRDELVRIYHIKQNYPDYSKDQLEQTLNSELDKLLNLVSDEQSFKNIQGRLKDQKHGLVQSLLVTGSGTNNLAERELRPLVLGRNVSYGSDTYRGMEVTATLASIIQTLGRGKQKDLLTELTLNLQIGIHEKYPQYTHLAYFDSS